MGVMSTTETATPAVDPKIVGMVDTYIAAWNEADDAKRAELIDAALGADLWYRDPMLEADGREAFAATVAAVQQQLAGHVMTRTSPVEGHHDVVRFNWALGVPGEAPAFAGVDVAKYDADGKLHRIVGFVPERAG